jgi:hypothetical protein
MAARLLNLQARLELQVRGSIARQLAITIILMTHEVPDNPEFSPW